MNIEYIEQSSSKNINLGVVNQYIDQLREIEDADRLDLLKIAMRLPDTLKTELNDTEEDEIKTIEGLLEKALINLNKYRFDEGSSLEEDFEKHATLLQYQITL